MANSQRGEFELRLGGVAYTLKLGTAALVEFQESLATPDGVVPDIASAMAEVKRGRLKYVRAMLWAGLRKHHRELTIEAVDDLIDASDPAEVGQLLGSLGASTQPSRADLEALGIDPNGNGARPTAAPPDEGTGRQSRKRKARMSGGGRSTSPPVAPA